VEAWFGRGFAHQILGQYHEAVADYSGAIKLDPKHVNAWYNRGLVYCDRLSRYDDAVADFAQAIALDPKYARPWYNRGVAYAKLGQYDKAADDYETFLKLVPAHAGPTTHWRGCWPPARTRNGLTRIGPFDWRESCATGAEGRELLAHARRGPLPRR